MSLKTFQAELYGLRAPGLKLRGFVPPTPRVAVVGSRAMNRRSREATEAIVERAASLGFSLVSGGARGVDISAHRRALRLRMPQLAVLPCPPEQIYPPEFAECFDEIARRPYSGLLFGLPAGTVQTRATFASRNRLVVGLSGATVVVQAASRSGSVGTGRLALASADGACAAVLGSRGCEALVGRGASSLGRAEDEGFGARVEAWLRAQLGEPVAADAQPQWPPHLRWLRDELATADATGRALDSFTQPLDALCALTEAVTLSLVVEASAGRYRLA